MTTPKRPNVGKDGPTTVHECRQLLAYHRARVAQLEERIDRIGSQWERVDREAA